MTNLASAIAAVSVLAFAAPAQAECSAQAAPASGRSTTTAASSFGVEREMKESGEKAAVQTASSYADPKAEGEKGGTADINIGVGELQECTISKSN